jgi:C1A family cysteine protease
MGGEFSSTNHPLQSLSVKNNRYGWYKDHHDPRDIYHKFDKNMKTKKYVDLRNLCPDVYDQGNLGSCTANAICAAFEYEQIRQGLRDFTPSRLFLYYNERYMENHVETDTGASIRDGIKSIHKIGVCDEIKWPYKIERFTLLPGQDAYKDALAHKSVLYKRVHQDIKELRRVLSLELPFVFGFSVYESFEQISNDGIMVFPEHGEKLLGGHAVMAIGYTNSHFIIRNSWGNSWGEQGYFYMPNDFILSDYCSDFWTIQKVSDKPISKNIYIHNSNIDNKPLETFDIINKCDINVENDMNSQTVNCINDVTNLENDMNSQTVNCINDVTNLENDMNSQTVNCINDVTNLENDMNSQTINCINDVTNLENDMNSQTVNCINDVTNLENDMNSQKVKYENDILIDSISLNDVITKTNKQIDKNVSENIKTSIKRRTRSSMNGYKMVN